MIFVQPHYTEHFIKYLKSKNWKFIGRTIPVAGRFVHLIFSSPEEEIYGFRYLNRWDNISEEEFQKSWENGIRDIYYYIDNSAEIQLDKQIDKWVIVSIGKEKGDYKPPSDVINRGIGLWLYYVNDIVKFHKGKIRKLSREMIFPDYQKSVLTPEFVMKFEREEFTQKDAIRIAEKSLDEGKIVAIEESLNSFKEEFKSALYNDFLVGGLFAGGFLVFLDGIIQISINNTIWFGLLIGPLVMLASGIPWYLRFRKINRRKKELEKIKNRK